MDQYRSAVTAMPSSAQLGGAQPLPFVRFPFFPTAPWYSTNPDVGYQVRFYSAGISPTDQDYTTPGVELQRSVQFDIPVRLIAFNGAVVPFDQQGAVDTTSAFLTEQAMNLAYLFRAEYTTGDKLHTQSRIASTVVGTSRNPGEIGGHGYNIDQGATLVLGITPLVLNLKIDITLVCLEMRAPRNFAIR